VRRAFRNDLPPLALSALALPALHFKLNLLCFFHTSEFAGGCSAAFRLGTKDQKKRTETKRNAWSLS